MRNRSNAKTRPASKFTSLSGSEFSVSFSFAPRLLTRLCCERHANRAPEQDSPWAGTAFELAKTACGLDLLSAWDAELRYRSVGDKLSFHATYGRYHVCYDLTFTLADRGYVLELDSLTADDHLITTDKPLSFRVPRRAPRFSVLADWDNLLIRIGFYPTCSTEDNAVTRTRRAWVHHLAAALVAFPATTSSLTTSLADVAEAYPDASTEVDPLFDSDARTVGSCLESSAREDKALLFLHLLMMRSRARFSGVPISALIPGGHAFVTAYKDPRSSEWNQPPCSEMRPASFATVDKLVSGLLEPKESARARYELGLLDTHGGRPATAPSYELSNYTGD